MARGDGFSDENILASAHYFKDHGFLASYFQPMVGYKGGGEYREGIPKVYLHYPPLPDILAGVTARVTGSLDPRVLRIVPFAFSIVWFFLIYAVMGMLVRDPRLASWAAALTVLSNYFLAWADNLCYHMYSELLVWAFVYVLLLRFHAGGKTRTNLACLWAIYFTAALTSFDAIVYLCIVTLGFSAIYLKTPLSRFTVLMGSAPVLALALRFLQNALYLGGADAALADFTSALFIRSVGGEWQDAPMWVQFYRLPFTFLNRFERFFFFPGFAFVIFAAFAFKELRKSDRERYRMAWVFLLATCAWPILMWQHSAAHTFTTRNAGLLVAMLGVAGLMAYLKHVVQNLKANRRGLCVFHGAVLVYVFAMAISQQVIQLYLVNGFLFR